jgi:hypothetical protein
MKLDTIAKIVAVRQLEEVNHRPFTVVGSPTQEASSSEFSDGERRCSRYVSHHLPPIYQRTSATATLVVTMLDQIHPYPYYRMILLGGVSRPVSFWKKGWSYTSSVSEMTDEQVKKKRQF